MGSMERKNLTEKQVENLKIAAKYFLNAADMESRNLAITYEHGNALIDQVALNGRIIHDLITSFLSEEKVPDSSQELAPVPEQPQYSNDFLGNLLAETDPSNWDEMTPEFHRGYYTAMIERILPILSDEMNSSTKSNTPSSSS